MDVPLEISYRNNTQTPEIDELVREKVAHLERLCDHITSCRISVEKPQEHMKAGNPYRVRIDLNVKPRHELVATREPGQGDMHEDLPAVIRDVFAAAERQVRKVVDKQHGETKHHEQQEASAIVEKLFPDASYGFVKTVDGRDVYFHRNSVLHNDFDRLSVGTGVSLMVEMGEKGLQATSVRIVDKPGERR
jgi:cold shock CspA family protein